MTGKVAKRSFALEATDLPSSPSGNCNGTNGILRYYCIPPDNNWKSIVFNHCFCENNSPLRTQIWCKGNSRVRTPTDRIVLQADAPLGKHGLRTQVTRRSTPSKCGLAPDRRNGSRSSG